MATCSGRLLSKQAGERWVVVRTLAGEDRARATLQRQVDKTREQWEKALWHLSNQRFACVRDARAPRARAQDVRRVAAGRERARHAAQAPPARTRTQERASRPGRVAGTDHLSVDTAAVAQEARRKAAFLVATNVLDPAQLSDYELIRTYKEQHSVERGWSFLKDPLFLASSVFVKKPERIVALSLVMVLCLLVYRLACRSPAAPHCQSISLVQERTVLADAPVSKRRSARCSRLLLRVRRLQR